MKRRFSREHLHKLASKGRGGLAGWARKQLGSRSTSSRKESIGGRGMTRKRYARRARSVLGGMGSGVNFAVGGAAYGIAERTVPQLQTIPPLIKVVGGLALSGQGGIVGAMAKAMVSVEGYKMGQAGLSFGGAPQIESGGLS